MRTVEVHAYNLRPGSHEEFDRLVVEKSLPLLKQWGVDVADFRPSSHDRDSYYQNPRVRQPGGSGVPPSCDLDRNIRKLLIAAQLSPDERQEFARLFRERVDDHRPAESRPDYGELLH